MRRQIAFYANTAAYAAVLETHGWGDLAVELNRLSRTQDADRWATMAGLVDDDVLDTFAVVAPPDRVAGLVADRVGGLADRISLYTAAPTDETLLADIARQISAIQVPPHRTTTQETP